MANQMTQGAISRIFGGDTTANPVVQVMDVKRLNAQAAPSASDRYRIMISDGVHYMQAMLATQLNNLIQENQLAAHCLIRLDEFICNTVQDRQIAIVLQLSVVSPSTGSLVGNPQPVDQKAAGAPAGASAQAPAAGAYQKPVPQYGNTSGSGAANPQGGQNSHQPTYQVGQQQQNMQRTQMDANVFPLSALNPFQNQRWTVKVRVTHKGDIKTWTNERGSGKLMSVDILDAEGSKMRVTMFNNEVDVFEPIFVQGNSYLISKGQVKPANKKFNTLGSDYEMTLDKNSLVERATDAANIPLQSYHFVALADIANISADKIIDIIGMITDVQDVTQINTKRGTQLSKRTLTLVDSSMASIEATLWGKFAESDLHADEILVMQAAKVSDWNAKTIGSSYSGNVESNPDLPEAHKLRAWYEANRNQLASVTQLTQQGVRPMQQDGGAGGSNFKPAEYKTFAEIRDQNLGRSAEHPDYFLLNATISSIKHDRDVWYNACPTCNKKVTEAAGAGGWVCEKCSQTFPNCARRYILRVTACDHSGSYWLNSFNDQGESIMGVPAAQLCEWKAAGDEKYEKAFDNALFKEFMFKCRAKEDNYQGETRVNVTINTCSGINYAEQIKRLEGLIGQYKALGYSPEPWGVKKE